MLIHELPLSEPILHALSDMGFTEPTEIQARAIPLMAEGKDVIGRSHTGTGKTVAFGAPAVELVEGSGAQVLILCPTRELAQQAEGEVRKIAKYSEGIKTAAVYGGEPIISQIHTLKRGAQIIIGTPGRVMDHINRHSLIMDHLKLVVLDEADEMLDMGFREDIETILETAPSERQTALFSATMPQEIMNIVDRYQHDPVIIETAGGEERTIDTVEQCCYEVPRGEKQHALAMLLHAHRPKLTMIFCNTKKMVDELGRYLNEHGFNASALHGDMKQEMRTSVMNSFKSGRTPILIATDVAARGIDVDDVDTVYNFDIPKDFEYYIHRIGRTGRAGRKGVSYTLADGPRDRSLLREIERFTHAKIKLLPLPDYEAIVDSRRAEIVAAMEAALADTADRMANGEAFAENKMLLALADKGFTPAQIAAAALDALLNQEMSQIPDVKAPIPVKANPLTPLGEGNVRLRLSVGRNNRVAPNQIVGAITEATGISGKRIGKIQCYGSYSLVEIPSELASRIIKAISGSLVGGVVTDCRLYSESDKRPFAPRKPQRASTKPAYPRKPRRRE